MKRLQSVPFVFFSGVILLACSGTPANKTTESNADNSSGISGTGKDMYYEYTSTTVSKDMTIKMDQKMYVSANGAMRVEMTVDNSAMKNKGLAKFVTLGKADKPNESISIDDDTKTYSINQFNADELNVGSNIKSSATKIGEERIFEFNSVHARIISNQTFGSGQYAISDIDTMDIWRSNEVPMPVSMKTMMDNYNAKAWKNVFSPETAKQLDEMGCKGFMTKIELHSKRSVLTESLIKVEHRDLPGSLFKVPAGYTESKE